MQCDMCCVISHDSEETLEQCLSSSGFREGLCEIVMLCFTYEEVKNISSW